MVVSLTYINKLSNQQFVQYFQNVFEYSPWVIHEALKQRPFLTEKDFSDVFFKIIQNAPASSKLSLIKAHPELGSNTRSLTQDSLKEQTGAKLNTLAQKEKDRLSQLNKTYQEKFGFPFIICVKNHADYHTIITKLQQRLSSTKDQEIDTALLEIHAIAIHRIQDLMQALMAKDITLSTHVLDLVSGKPAANVKLDLFYRCDLLFEGKTDMQGRCQIQKQGLILLPATYQLVFYMADYFKEQHYPISDPPFLNRIRIDFGISQNSSSHYHVPLLVSPHGFSTYKGS